MHACMPHKDLAALGTCTADASGDDALMDGCSDAAVVRGSDSDRGVPQTPTVFQIQ